MRLTSEEIEVMEWYVGEAIDKLTAGVKRGVPAFAPYLPEDRRAILLVVQDKLAREVRGIPEVA